MADFISSDHIGVYFLIFFGKIAEVTVATLRIVLINRGEKTKGSIFAFIENILWVLITGTVLTGFQSNPMKIVVMALAFAMGNYLGSWLENKLAVGLSTIQVIASGEEKELVGAIRALNIAVTVIRGEGKDGERSILLIHLKRNRIPSTVRVINKVSPQAVISMSDVKMIHGGYIKK